MLKLPEWDLESGARASPTFVIPAKSEQADPARKVVLDSGWVGFSPFFSPVLHTLLCSQCCTAIGCGISGVTMPKLRPLRREDLLSVPSLPPALETPGLGLYFGLTRAEQKQFGTSGRVFLSHPVTLG